MRQILCLSLTVLLLQPVLASAADEARPFEARANSHRLTAVTEDLATLANLQLGRDVSVRAHPNGEDLIVFDSDRKVLFTLRFVMGTGELRGLPVEISSSLGSVADVSRPWRNILTSYEAKRQAFQELRPESTPEQFEAWYAETAKLAELMQPIDTAVARVIKESFENLKSNASANSAAPNRDWQAFEKRMRNDKLRFRLELGVPLIGGGLMAYGLYEMISRYNQPTYLSLGVDNSWNWIMSGVGVTMIFLVNQAPIFFSQKSSNFLDQIVDRFRKSKVSRAQAALKAAELKKFAELKAEVEQRSSTGFQFGATTLKLKVGSLTEIASDAWVIPQFAAGANSGGVVAAVEHAGGTAGIDAYQKDIDENGARKFGSLLITPSGGAVKAGHFMHVTTVGSPGPLTVLNPAASARREYTLIRDTLVEVFSEARKNGFKSIVVPELGTGIIGSLNGRASLRALLEAIAISEQQNPVQALEVIFALWRHPSVYADYESTVLEAQTQGFIANRNFLPTERDRLIWACEAALK